MINILRKCPWIPHITVASVIEKEKKYLFVEEYVKDLKVLNQPAGHLEENETIEEACARDLRRDCLQSES